MFRGLLFCCCLLLCSQAMAQEYSEKAGLSIYELIKTYGEARASQDTAALAAILTSDVDQLVSSGAWRTGVEETLSGMVQSSESNPGARTLNVQKIRFLTPEVAVVDAKYMIQQANGEERNMWSTFVVVNTNLKWRIAAVRNMMPSD
jgi:uncharacterized protein (TIGR02246 family)